MGILLTDSRGVVVRGPKQPYPKYLIHADGRTCIVPDLEAHRALGDGWPLPAGDPAWTSTEFGAVPAEKQENTGEHPEKPKRGRPRKDAA